MPNITNGESLSTARTKINDSITVTDNLETNIDAHLNTGTATTGEYLQWSGTDYQWAAGGGGGYTDSDVDLHLNTSTATTGQVLSWDGVDYDWVTGGGGYSDADVDTHLNTSTAATGEVLSWNGTDYDWVAAGSGGGGTTGVWTLSVELNGSPLRNNNPWAGYGNMFEVTKDCTIYGFTLRGYDLGTVKGFAVKMSSNNPASASITAISGSTPDVTQNSWASSTSPGITTFLFSSPVSFVAGDYIALPVFNTTGLGTDPVRVDATGSGAFNIPADTEHLKFLGAVRFDDGNASAVTTGWVSNGSTFIIVGQAFLLMEASGGGSGISNVVEDTTPQLGGDLDLNSFSILNLAVSGSITEEVYTLTGTSVALDPANGTIQSHTLTGTTTYTDSLATGQSITLVIPGTANTITWPTIKWLGGTEPALDGTNDNIISVFKIGTTLYGSPLGVFS